MDFVSSSPVKQRDTIGYTDDVSRGDKARSLGGFRRQCRALSDGTHESARRLDTRTPDKKWRRAWNLQLTDRFNPAWRDLFEAFNKAKEPGPGSPGRRRWEGDRVGPTRWRRERSRRRKS